MRPNLLLVVFDTARRDAFEPYGAAPGSSPAVAQLASAGCAHPAAYSTGCWTVPGHGSLFTGLLPRSAGLGHTGMDQFKDFPGTLAAQEDRLLPTVLRRAGYDTAGISTNAWISKRTGFATGFERFTQVLSPRAKGIGDAGWKERARWYLQSIRARADDGARAVDAHLDQWLRARERRPFFWFVNLMECHSPYLPPRPFTSLGTGRRLQAAREAVLHLGHDAIWRNSCGDFAVPDEALDRMRRLYADSIRQLDAWLARVLERLEERGVLESTQVVVTSDHGENFGDGGLLGHGFSLDDRLLRVPFVSAGPVSLDREGVLSLATVPAVLARSLGVTDHPWQDGDAGVAVAQFDAPGRAGDARVDDLVARWGLDEEGRDRLCTSFACATDGALKLLRTPSGEVLIDLAADPGELAPQPVTAAGRERHGARLAMLASALDQAEAAESHEPPPPPIATGGTDETDALEAQLRLLGYL